ncbi:MAG: flagellar export chaperone FliS [Hydrogenophaga sp.]|jgi:flagellar protein FliS|uniref:Flagellar secretion chaperone FliS n=1 Tax=Hydrogenophaga intermedia TaxID=65786 RepID=A0A1L1PN06_HYDIT|nr:MULTISPECIES: flagellar export chaperone FliS [Hydrogenophaga]AOS77783.1 flagellar export chaperone FliS [Hydrogenophaga sp. PBC]NIM41982.1 flagellar export chaperone FliS [Hydrogenophaga sp.]NIN27285.1 flagellar export chaperone FliS [Hydrogenophaga sp.]NIN31986.1 flagellar export chaperone FliS [Hydrogenophaga sp.]NIN56379.1 flagellar export chaperone FliS [Hydrogenophaga sp.]
MFTSVNTRSASVYKRVAVETGVQAADSHRLVGMLFDGLLQAVAAARGAMERGDLVVKGEQIGKAVRIVEEGLKAGLDPAGGEMAQNLRALYAYSVRRLTEANLRNDPSALAEVATLIEPVAQAWQDIRGQALQGA